jgi:hypothetical protein
MGTAHGAKELGMCAHGYACQTGARGRYIGFCLGLPSGVPNCQNRNRHNLVKNLVRDSILSTYYSKSQGASFAPIWTAWEIFYCYVTGPFLRYTNSNSAGGRLGVSYVGPAL